MASVVAPKLDAATLPATPAHEWADETSAKLDASVTPGDRPPLVQGLSTPGVEVPGSYPRGADSTASSSGGILDMAKQYLPGQEDVQGALRNATETAKTYLPPSVAAYLPGGATKETSLPSQEGAQKPLEHSDGIGSLPGNASEASVAKLPDEREEENRPKSHNDTVDATADANRVSNLPVALDPPKVQATSDLTPATNPEMKETVSSASIQAQIGDTPSLATPIPEAPTAPSAPVGGIGGVGDLPGSKSESTVALLPDERKEAKDAKDAREAKDATKSTSPGGEPALNLVPQPRALGAEGTTFNGVPLDSDPTTNIGGNPGRARADGAVADTPAGAATSTPRNLDHTDSTRAMTGHSDINSSTPSIGTNGSRFTETPTKTNTELASTTSGGTTGSEGSRSVGGTPRKPKLMDKIKGEVKVITGKLGGKEEKVEEGRRLMGKV
ncbi:hypothetical protein V5O48_011433 [Marasmius crinis-equi]|uniref:Uncharacterized protein n=1 Tax=Marasmius crinis-equi TaxID=585013 RepID=A0ABR3F5N4_9AGAR